MKIKGWLLWLMAGVLVVSLCACQKKDKEETPTPSEPEAVVDPNYPVAIGEIRVIVRPDTIVSLSPAMTELLCELGVGDRLAGISDYCDYPESITSLPRCGTAQIPNWEQLKQISPQVVFASSTLTQADTVRFQQMGAEVVVLPSVDSLDALEERYLTAGIILEGMQDGEQLGKDTLYPLRERYYQLFEQGGRIEKPLSGIYLRGVPLMMATGETLEGILMTQIGISNAASEYTGWSYPEDKAADLYPDVIFYDQSIDPEYFKTTKIYSTTDAVKKGRLYPIDATAFERQSQRMLEQLEQMFEAAYGDGGTTTSGVIEEPK